MPNSRTQSQAIDGGGIVKTWLLNELAWAYKQFSIGTSELLFEQLNIIQDYLNDDSDERSLQEVRKELGLCVNGKCGWLVNCKCEDSQ